MKGKVTVNDKPIFVEYCPSNVNPNIGFKDKVYESVGQLNKETNGPVTAAMVREHTGLGKTVIQKHLNTLVKEGLLNQRFGKFKFGSSTSICGCYELIK